jgi:hypothetical protein
MARTHPLTDSVRSGPPSRLASSKRESALTKAEELHSRAIDAMREALRLLDEAEAAMPPEERTFAAAHLQHAIDTATRAPIPMHAPGDDIERLDALN